MNAAIGGASDMLDKRVTAKEFFTQLEKYLNKNLPTIDAVNKDILERRTEYERTKNAKLTDYEPRFFKTHVVCKVHEFLWKEYGLKDPDVAKRAVLAEGFNSPKFTDLKKCSSGTPASAQIYPWKKTLLTTLKTARKEWWGAGKVLSNSCPDIALCLPGGPSIVFEGKLFRSGGSDVAKSAIVAGIYECFFYRALPTLLKAQEPQPSSYDYACFLAYDASPSGALRTAWREINPQVSGSCWDALNIYVMIVCGPQSAQAEPY